MHMGSGGVPPYIYMGVPLSIYMGGGGSPLHVKEQYSWGTYPHYRGECTQQDSYRYLVLNTCTDALTLQRHSQYAQ